MIAEEQGKEDEEEEEEEDARVRELKSMRWLKSFTAFDIDIDEVEEYPWRQANTDLTNYFNFGFNEATWTDYCERQLRLRYLSITSFLNY